MSDRCRVHSFEFRLLWFTNLNMCPESSQKYYTFDIIMSPTGLKRLDLMTFCWDQYFFINMQHYNSVRKVLQLYLTFLPFTVDRIIL